jgi:hypothetical protein
MESTCWWKQQESTCSWKQQVTRKRVHPTYYVTHSKQQVTRKGFGAMYACIIRMYSLYVFRLCGCMYVFPVRMFSLANSWALQRFPLPVHSGSFHFKIVWALGYKYLHKLYLIKRMM